MYSSSCPPSCGQFCACLSGLGVREYWQEGESRSGQQNSLTIGFIFKGQIAYGWDLARLPGK